MSKAHLTFYKEAKEVRGGGEDGKPKFIDVDYVKIMAAGDSKNIPVYEISEDLLANWSRSLDEGIRSRVKAYEYWKAGNEDVFIDGTSLKHWPAISPAQLKTCQSCSIFSVEALADLPDSSINILGMHGRALRDKARDWLKAAANTGHLAQQLTEMRTELERLARENEEQKETIQSLKAEQSSLKKK